jgi:cbb3-type cytochrome oxidase subunit 3
MRGGMDLSIFPKIGLIIFVGFFVLSLLWVYRPRGAKTYEKTSNIPFDEAPTDER